MGRMLESPKSWKVSSCEPKCIANTAHHIGIYVCKRDFLHAVDVPLYY